MEDKSSDLQFDDWAGLTDKLLSTDWTAWVFRGQEVFDWSLQTRLQRTLEGVEPWAWRGLEDLAIGQFKAGARQCLTDIPEHGDALGWLALMQHYGAPTRLLDWSESPFVAIWFAYASSRDSDAALWALSAGPIRSQQGSPMPFGLDQLGIDATHTRSQDDVHVSYPGEGFVPEAWENELLRHSIRSETALPIPFLPPRADRRMANQRSVFTLDSTLQGITFPLAQERTVINPGPGPNGEGLTLSSAMDPLLFRIRLPRAWRKEALNALRSMNITAATLFPGLDGVGRDICLNIQNRLSLSMQDVFDGRAWPLQRLQDDASS